MEHVYFIDSVRFKQSPGVFGKYMGHRGVIYVISKYICAHCVGLGSNPSRVIKHVLSKICD